MLVCDETQDYGEQRHADGDGRDRQEDFYGCILKA
jgi:hypothetical protein